MSALTISAVLGRIPWDGTVGVTVDVDTRAAVRTWLNRCGWPTESYINLDLATLQAVYCDPAVYLARKPDGAVIDATTAQGHALSDYAPRNAKLVESLKRRGLLPVDGTPAPVVPVAPVPVPVSAPVEGGKVEALRDILRDIVGEPKAALDEARVIALIAEHSAKPRIVEHRVTIVTSTPAPERVLDGEIRHAAFADILTSVATRENVMVVGPAGCSKTHMAGQVAKALGVPFYFTGAIASEYKLTGFIDAQGRIISPAFRQAYEKGGLFLFDEMDASAPQALLAFNAGLANGHMDFPDRCVERHPDFYAMGATNTFGRGQDRVYVGRNQLDAASLDRFIVEAIDYDESMERALYGDTAWAARCHKVRAAVRSLSIRHVVSMRAIQQGTKLLSAGMAQDKVEDRVLWRGLDAAQVAKVKAAV